MTRSARYSRRRVLQGLGMGAGLLPLLESRAAMGASSAAYPRRLMILLQGNGTIADGFFPQGQGSDLTRLTLPFGTGPLAPYARDLIFMENLELRLMDTWPPENKGHQAYAIIFAGSPGRFRKDGDNTVTYPSSPTIDQVIADKLVAGGVKTPLGKLHLAVQTFVGEAWERNCFYTGPEQPAPSVYSPARAAATVFGTAANQPDFERMRAERHSMLDFLKDDVARFRQRVSKVDQNKIDAHLGSVRALEEQLSNAGKVQCTSMTKGSYPADDDGIANEKNHRDVMNAHLDIAVAALACDVTRLVTVQLCNSAGSFPHLNYPWLSLGPPSGNWDVRNAHDVAHSPGANGTDKITLENWYSQQLVGLIQRMKAVPEGSGTLFDNTAILWANHMGNGAGHTVDHLPWIIAGSCGGALKTGQYLRLPQRSPTQGVLIALANAMGADIEYFDDAQWGGEYTQLRA